MKTRQTRKLTIKSQTVRSLQVSERQLSDQDLVRVAGGSISNVRLA